MGFGSLISLAALVGGAVPRENTGFVPGHVFVAMREPEACLDGRGWIVEIDPDSGAWSIFADGNQRFFELCGVNGLRFTPDGTRLLAAHFGSAIRAYAPDGSSEIILDGSDGLNRPVGANCLAFDAGGDLYVVNGDNTIRRFAGGKPPATVFADYDDGIRSRGALGFHPAGDLFYTGDLAGKVIRINPAGQASVFDSTRGFVTLAMDRDENLFVAQGSRVYRYDGPGPDPTTRRILADGFNGFYNEVAIAFSPDQRLLYFAEWPGRVHGIDPDTGASDLIADFSELGAFPTGATVYAPDPDLIPGRCCFGLHTEDPGCIDGITRPECGDDEPAPFVFTAKAACAGDEAACETITGACCDIDAFGGCTEDTLIFECQCATCEWHESAACGEVGCALTAIPTASAWGLTTLTLSLMIGAKIVFGTVDGGGSLA